MVLHLSTFHLEGGAGVAATRLHRALVKAGIESEMLVPSSLLEEDNVTSLAENKWDSRVAWGRFVAERLYFLPQEKDKSIRFAFSPAEVGADVSQHPLVERANIIHLHWINFGFLSINSLSKLFSLGKPVVWTLHDMWTFTGGCHYSRGCNHYLNHCCYCPFLAKPDQYDISFSQFEFKKDLYDQTRLALISPSLWLDKTVKTAALTKHLHSLNIPNCIDTAIFKPLNTAEIRAKLQLPANKRFILFVGANTQDPRKGFNFFREAMALLRKDFDDLEVLILGKARAIAFDEFPVPVHYLGKITRTEDLINAYNAVDLIVVPSLEDNLPNTIMEAMACAIPAVGFATGGIPEMIDHQVNGYVSENRSAASLAEGISWIIQNNSNGDLSSNAREKVLNTYSEHIIAEKYRILYQSMLNE